jgi:hypothetical protein
MKRRRGRHQRQGKILGAGKEVTGSTAGRRPSDQNIVIIHRLDIARLKGIEIDEKRVVSSTGALSLEKVPEASDHRRWRDRARAWLGRRLG